MSEIQIRFISTNAIPAKMGGGLYEVAHDELEGRTFRISALENKLSVHPVVSENRDLGDERDDPLLEDKIVGVLWRRDLRDAVAADMGPMVMNRFLGYHLARRREASERIAKINRPHAAAAEPG